MNKKEIDSPFKKFKKPIIEILPLTIMGILIVILFSAGRLNESGQDTLIDVIRTGGHILFLFTFYFLGYTVWYLINNIPSYFTHEEEVTP